mgnify:FL=1|tara:strand:- start:2836 stop:2979 length:144 start_codon:yes stop_codon:yes gene_type:complete
METDENPQETEVQVEEKPKKKATPKPATPVTSTERARAIVRAKLAAR